MLQPRPNSFRLRTFQVQADAQGGQHGIRLSLATPQQQLVGAIQLIAGDGTRSKLLHRQPLQPEMGGPLHPGGPATTEQQRLLHRRIQRRSPRRRMMLELIEQRLPALGRSDQLSRRWQGSGIAWKRGRWSGRWPATGQRLSKKATVQRIQRRGQRLTHCRFHSMPMPGVNQGQRLPPLLLGGAQLRNRPLQMTELGYRIAEPA